MRGRAVLLTLGPGEIPVHVTWVDTLHPHEAPLGQTLEVFEVVVFRPWNTVSIQFSEWATGKSLERTDSHVRTCHTGEIARLHAVICPERQWDFPELDDIIDACEAIIIGNPPEGIP